MAECKACHRSLPLTDGYPHGGTDWQDNGTHWMCSLTSARAEAERLTAEVADLRAWQENAITLIHEREDALVSEREARERAERALDETRGVLRRVMAHIDVLRDDTVTVLDMPLDRCWAMVDDFDAARTLAASCAALAASRDAAPGPAPDRFDCQACRAIGVRVDEDGCCVTCGHDAVVFRGGVPTYPPHDEEPARDEATLPLPLASSARESTAGAAGGEGGES